MLENAVMPQGVAGVENCLPPSLPRGALHLLTGQPNPQGAGDAAVYLLRGDATAGPITRIVPAEGVCFPSSLLPLARPVRIKVLHFNDLHGRVVAFTGQGCVPILSRMVTRLRAARDESDHNPRVAVLVASAGDDCGGVIFDELLGHDPASYQLHAGYRLSSRAGVDVGVLGNHDFDRGTALLAHAVRQDAAFPILAANVTGSPALAECCCPGALFVIKGVRVGFIGLITPAQIHPEPGSARRITDPVEAAHHLIPAMRPLCDALIILSHLGYNLDQHSAAVEIAGDVELARGLSPGSVDLIVGGHTHNALNEGGLGAGNIVNGIPIVQAGKAGQFVGEVDIEVGEAVTVTHARLHATVDLPIDTKFEREQVQPLVECVQPTRARLIGRVGEDEDLGADAVRNRFARGESALANFITDALVNQAGTHGYPVDFAIVDSAGVSCGLPAGGELTFGQWFDVMPYADVLCLFSLSGRQFRALLQDNAWRIDRPGEPHTERGFLHFSAAVRYTVHLGPQRGQARAGEIRVHGEPVEPDLDRTFLVASPSFVRGLSAAWEACAPAAFSVGVPKVAGDTSGDENIAAEHPELVEGRGAAVAQGRILRQAQDARSFGGTLFDLRSLPREFTRLRVRDLLVDHIVAHGGVLPEGGAKRDGRLRVLASGREGSG